jgi:phenylacetate-CoA ligase
MIGNRDVETLSRASLAAVQRDRLRSLVARLRERVAFCRVKLDAAGIRPSAVKDLKDLEGLPFTSKGDLRETYPYGLLAVEPRGIVEIHTSSGTTGRPVVDAYTAGDIDVWSEVDGRAFDPRANAAVD